MGSAQTGDYLNKRTNPGWFGDDPTGLSDSTQRVNSVFRWRSCSTKVKVTQCPLRRFLPSDGCISCNGSGYTQCALGAAEDLAAWFKTTLQLHGRLLLLHTTERRASDLTG